MRQLFPIFLALLAACQIMAQSAVKSESEQAIPDSSFADSLFDVNSAWNYVERATLNRELWRADSDRMVEALKRLLDHTREPYDSAALFLRSNDFSKVPIHRGTPVIVEKVDVKWINDSAFVVNPQGWNPNLYLKMEKRYVYPVDFSTLVLSDSLLDENGMLDSTLFIPDTILQQVIDTAAIRELEIRLYKYLNGSITPPLSDPSSGRVARLSKDRAQIHYSLPGTTWIADETSPFYILGSKQQLDSLQKAINTLLDYNLRRDSTLLVINDMFGKESPYWLTTGRDRTFRFWVKNFNNDSLTLWIGNPGTNEISLLMEDDVNFNRLVQEKISYLPLFLEQPKRALQEMAMLEPEPIYWDFAMSNLLGLSQTYLGNWTKGGESSLSTTIDVMGRATYNNKDANTQWINVARWKFGTIWTKEKGNRVNNDQFEVDSKYNLNAWGKIGMSSSLYMKTQIAKGFNYPNDSVPVSKFLNPGTITLGLGAEYKPIDKTTINFAPLSYKTTFVLDTAHIDQTRHGIAADKSAKRELGLQVVLNHEIKPLKDLTMINRVRLFSNYLYKPQNVDVDWEMILEQKINWFFTIRLNLHLIYDDDVRFPVFDANDEPVTYPDGSKKEVARPQFREFLGLTLSFNL